MTNRKTSRLTDSTEVALLITFGIHIPIQLGFWQQFIFRTTEKNLHHQENLKHKKKNKSKRNLANEIDDRYRIQRRYTTQD